MTDPIEIAGYQIATSLPELPPSAVRRPVIINTINTHSWVVAEKDPMLREALSSSDVLLPDGEGVVWAVRYLTGQKIKKIAGFDIHKYLLEYLNHTGGSCFYLGGSEKTLGLIKDRLAREYPNVKAGFYSPPFKDAFDEEDNSKIYYELRKTRDEINSAISYSPLTAHGSPFTVLFVGMTAPKQEKWVHQNKDNIHADIICSIGAVFDFYTGTVNRPPEWMIRMKLEWLGRLLSNPKRIWKRVVHSGPKFLILINRIKHNHS